MKKIVLAGGTGFIGRYFEEQFTKQGAEVIHISRRPQHVQWTDAAGLTNALDGADILINLAGRTVNCRYTEKNRREIMDSRLDTTCALREAILECAAPPALWINASTATIYRHAEDKPMTERDGEIGSGFSVEVAKAWEQAFFSSRLPDTRMAALRISIVLGKGGGVIVPYRNLVKFGLGGVQGPGTQMFSFIHVADLFRIVEFIETNENSSGVFNCAAPHPVTNREFMAALKKAMGRRFGLPAAKWMLEAGAFVLRTETELILKSRWVVPDRLLTAGFSFQYETIEDVLQDIL